MLDDKLSKASKYTHIGKKRGVGGPYFRNRRSVWTVSPVAYKGAHFAVFPSKLVEPCILAGCPRGGVVLDIFAGSGTTGLVAMDHDRKFKGIELNPEYFSLMHDRIRSKMQ